MATDKQVELRITAKNLTQPELDKARQAVQGFARETEGASAKTAGFGAMLRGVSPLAAAFGATLSIGAVVNFGKALLDDADALVKMSDKTGIAIEPLQRLKFAAEDSGNSFEQVTAAISMMQKRLAEGNDSAVGALKALGFEFDAFMQLSPDQQFTAIATEVRKIEDPMQRAKVATELFSELGLQVLPTMRADLEKLGLAAPVMSEKAVRAFDDIGTSLSLVWGRTKNAIAEGIVVALETGGRAVQGFKTAWEAIPRPLKDAGAVAVVTTASLWALHAASGALVKTQVATWALAAAGGIKTLGQMTLAFGWQGFAVTLGSWVAPLTKITGLLAALPGGLLALGGAMGAVTTAGALSAALGEKGYTGLRQGIENLIGAQQRQKAAQDEQTAATQRTVDAEARFFDAASKRVAAERAHAALLDTLKTKQGDLANELGRFTAQTLTDAVKAIRTNQAAFEAWAESQQLSKEAIAFLTAEAKKQEEQEKKTAEAAKKHAEARAALTAATRTLTDSEMTRIDNLVRQGADEATIVTLTGIHEAAVRKYLAALKDQQDAETKLKEFQLDRLKAVTEANAKAAAEIMAREQAKLRVSTDSIGTLFLVEQEYTQKIAEQRLQGTELELFRLDQAYQAEVAALGKRDAANAQVWDRAKARIDAYYAHERQQLEQSQGAWRQFGQLAMHTIGQLQTSVSGSFAAMMLGAKGFKDGMLDIWGSIKAAAVRVFAEIADAWISGMLKRMLAALAGNRQAFAGGFASLIPGAGAMGLPGGGGVPGASGSMIGPELGPGTGPLTGGGTNWGAMAGGGIMAVGGLFGLWRALQSGSKVGAAVSGASTGAGIGTMIAPGIGTAIGAGVGAIGGWIASLFGPSKEAKANKAATQEIQQLKQQLLDTYGTLEKIKALGPTGEAIAAAWGSQSQAGLAHFKTLMSEFLETQERTTAALQKYGFTWEDQDQAARQSHVSAWAKELLADHKALVDSGIDWTKVTDKQAAAWSELVQAAQRSGTTLPESVRPMIEHLREIGLLTTEDTDKVQALLDTFAERSKAATDTLAKLDGELAALNASEAPEEVMGIVEANTRARIDAERKIAEEKLAQIEQEKAEALKALEAEQGTTRETFETLFTDVTVKSGEAAAEVAEQWRKAPWEDWGPVPRPSASAVPGYASGALITSPHLAMVGEGGERELIGPVGFMAEALAGAMAMVGGGGGTRIVIENRNYLDGRELVRGMDRYGRDMAEIVVPWVPGSVKRYGVARR